MISSTTIPTISFVSIQKNENFGWDIVKKTFPEISGTSITLSVTAVSIAPHFFNQEKTAEVAAKVIAELNHLPYVSENASIITVTSLCNCYLPVELTPNGGVIGQGTAVLSLQSAIIEAKNKAEKRNLLFISS